MKDAEVEPRRKSADKFTFYGKDPIRIPGELITAHKQEEVDADHVVDQIEKRECKPCNRFWKGSYIRDKRRAELETILQTNEK